MMAEEEVDGQSHSAAKNALTEEEFKKLETEADIRIKEDAVRNILSPYEGYVMAVQSLLVWEKPRRSIMLLLCVNGFVWLMVTSNYNIVFKVTLAFITAITSHTFYKKVWPDMKVEPKSPVPEGWTPLEPELVQFHDICHYTAVTWHHSIEKHRQFWELRKKQPGKFCVCVCFISLCVFLFGLRISGAVATYLFVSCVVTVPGILHRGLHRSLYLKVKPYLTQMEHSMDDRAARAKKKRRARSSKQAGEDYVDYSSSDIELADFIPSPGPALDAALAHAAAPYDDTPGSSTRASPLSELVGGLLARGPSLELTDDDLLTDNENNSLAFAPMENIPAFDESDSHRVRHRRPKQTVPSEPPPPYQPAEPLLTRDMSETHFRAIQPDEFSNRTTPFSSSEDLIDSSPDIPMDDAFDDDGDDDEVDNHMTGLDAARLTPEINEPKDYHEQQSTVQSSGASETLNTGMLVEPTEGPSRFSRAAASFLSETVASVASLVSGKNQDPSASQRPIQPAGEEATGGSTHPGPEPDLSDYEMLDTSEINDNERNARTEQGEGKDGSFTEFFSSLFGAKE